MLTLLKTRSGSHARFHLCQYAVKILDCKDHLAMTKIVAEYGAKVY
jgi:hypothetical protein